MAVFEPILSRVSFPALEQGVLDFWRDHEVFRRSVDERPEDRIFTFYEGPPTANGNPGIHHVLARVFKDLIPRYKTMQGYRVPRKGGWDTHGLPVELEVEKQLGLRSKPDIEVYGIEEFNRQCRESVFRYVEQWERMTERIGFWVDLDDAYVTYSREYIETCWWIFKRLWDSDLMFRDYRVTPHCPRCGTSLSSHEIALGYKEDTPDPSVTVRFRLLPEPNPEAPAAPIVEAVLRTAAPGTPPTSLLAWTTTPWTLPGNVALAVSAAADYAVVVHEGEQLILARDRVEAVVGEGAEVVAAFKGADLVGLRYEPLYESREWEGVEAEVFLDGRAQRGEAASDPRARRVVAADFVATDDGTGIVHIAPAFGEDDYALGRAEGLLLLQPVSLAGEFVGGPWAGEFVKQADRGIIRDLRERGLLWRDEQIRHTYPFCWRCDTPVLYYAKPSWYIRTTAVRDRLIEGNQRIHWVPGHIRDGRFGEWLEGNIDWAVSRERYWGTPLPFWVCEGCQRVDCIGSYGELRERAGAAEEIEDPHRPYIDAVTFACLDCGATMRRIPEVADAWFDSGAMPYAQWHMPQGAATFEQRFPADFICEAVDQTRGWFYTLHALATLLHRTEDVPESIAYRNVICLGHILDAQGQKMSKSRGNVVDPWTVLDEHGADALRWYLYTASPPGNSRRFSADLVGETARRFISTLWNTYSFFVTYANIAEFDPASTPPTDDERSELDRWARSELHQTVRRVTDALEAYEPADAARPIGEFVEQLSNWYVRRSRRRFWKSDDSADTQAALHTLYECLTTVTRLLAPFTPFLADAMYRNLVAGKAEGASDSVHLATWPEVDEAAIDERLSSEVGLVQRMVSLGRAARQQANAKVRQPLAEAELVARTSEERAALDRLAYEVADELNVEKVSVIYPYVPTGVGGIESKEAFGFPVIHGGFSVRPNPQVLGPRLGRELETVRKALSGLEPERAAQIVEHFRTGEFVEVEGTSLTGSEVFVTVNADAGWAAAEESGYAVLIDTTITDALRDKGLMRELVRRLQDLRREAGLEVTDRIRVTWRGDAEVGKVMADHGPTIAEEVLALSLDAGDGGAPLPEGAATTSVTVDGHEVTLALVKA